MFMSSTSNNNLGETNKGIKSVNNPEERIRSKFGEKVIIEETEELQPHWAAMERRVKQKVSKLPGEGPQGRSNKRTSAWDAEYV